MEKSDSDQGHKALVDDIGTLEEDVKNFEFHDFKNETHATPKMELRKRLIGIIEDVMAGKYDNNQ